jgi:hypothetical protein
MYDVMPHPVEKIPLDPAARPESSLATSHICCRANQLDRELEGDAFAAHSERRTSTQKKSMHLRHSIVRLG